MEFQSRSQSAFESIGVRGHRPRPRAGRSTAQFTSAFNSSVTGHEPPRTGAGGAPARDNCPRRTTKGAQAPAQRCPECSRGGGVHVGRRQCGRQVDPDQDPRGRRNQPSTSGQANGETWETGVPELIAGQPIEHPELSWERSGLASGGTSLPRTRLSCQLHCSPGKIQGVPQT